MTNENECDILISVVRKLFARSWSGGIAQLARALGSYPNGRRFKSSFRYHIRPVGQAVKTRPFHGCNMGSIPVRVTSKTKRTLTGVSFLLCWQPLRVAYTSPKHFCFGLGTHCMPCPSASEACQARHLPVQIFVSSLLNENLLVRTNLVERYISHFRLKPTGARSQEAKRK